MSTDRIMSRFGAASTALEVVAGHDLTGRAAIVTGATAGIGVETARALATAGADVTLAVRNLAAGNRVADDINRGLAHPRVRAAALELGDLASVRAFAAAWGGRPLHLLVNNAGIMACPLQRTADGFEQQFGVNHLGHFLLTRLLMDSLLAAAPARVVVLTSAAHHLADIDFDDPNHAHRPYDPFLAYGQSKTANVLFAVELTRRYAARGVTANAVMPGAVTTELGRHLDKAALQAKGWLDENGNVPGAKTPAQGSATSVWAAVGPELAGIGGRYLEDCAEALPYSAERPHGGVKAHALDTATAARLWTLSERLTGLPVSD
jgi:NAD(P)-dependent dehydrogenase (short-subunit alcohol dehydrogenase family)